MLGLITVTKGLLRDIGYLIGFALFAEVAFQLPGLGLTLELASLKLETGDPHAALVPLLVVCDSLADDRLAPAARQRAGEAYLALGDEKNALAQYEECLARYPRAWNSAEVRRRVERLRKDRRL